jgi:hypothetical protein
MPCSRLSAESFLVARRWSGADFSAARDKNIDFYGLSRFLLQKNRIKCGENAVFPQRLWYKMRIIAAKIQNSIKEDSWPLA